MTPREQLLAAVGRLPKDRVRWHPRWDDPRIGGGVNGGQFAPGWVMVHHTAGTNSLGPLTSGAPYAPVPGAHFLINRDGTVWVLSHRQAYHAGPQRDVPGDGTPVSGGGNLASWGIEVESLGRRRDFTKEQIDTLGRLMSGLVDAMRQTDSRIVNHKDWRQGAKVDTLYDPSVLRAWSAAGRRAWEAERDTNRGEDRAPFWRRMWYSIPAARRPLRQHPRDERTERAVRELQRRLPGDHSVTGEYGPLTAASVKAYQRKRPWLWPADGVAGPRTYRAILGGPVVKK